MQLIKYIHRGYRCTWNGAFCTSLLIAAACFSTISAAKNITLNLKDADISAVISTVSEATGKNFIVDPRVKGKVTIISSHPMASEELYSVFLSILEVHGFSAVPSGNVIKILPDASAKQKAMPLADDEFPGEGDQIVTRVIALKNVSSSQLVPILRPLVPQQGHLAAYVPANILIISDRAANIARLMNIIRRIDTPSNDQIEIIQLEHASAAEVVRIMTSLEQKGKGKGKGIGASTGGAPILIADERTNSILVGGGKAGRLRIKAIISHLDTPLDKGGNTRVIYLRYAQAEDMVKVLTGVSKSVERQGKGKGAAANKAKVDIQADEATNALVITAPPDIFRSLESVIKQLDIRRAQVLIETVIAEVSENLSNELGVQWVFDGTPAGDQPVGVVNFGAGSGGSIAEIGAAVSAGLPPSIGNGATIGLGRFNSSTLNFAAVLRVLKGDGTTNILSTPTLVTMDNEEAEIVIGQTVPFITGAFTSPGGGGATPTNPFQTIKRENVGITLKVKPQINEGDAVKLEIEQTIDSISSSAVGAVDLITNTRSIKTNVIVDDGQMIVLGGLINDEVRESVQKVPLLGDIPLLGWLFSHKTSSKVKQNLMMFLQPTIIRDAALSARLTHSKYSYQRARQLEVRDKGLLMLPKNASPVMPTMQEALALPPVFEVDAIPGSDSVASE